MMWFFAGGSGLVGRAGAALPETCRRKSLSIAPMLEVVECDHRLMFRFGDRPLSGAAAGPGRGGTAAASSLEMYWLMESELAGLACEADFLWPIFAPRCFTVETDEVVEFDRDSLRLTAGGRVEWLMFVVVLEACELRRFNSRSRLSKA